VKIGIVNDLPMVAEALRRTVALAPQHEVIWIAKNGIEAVEFCAQRTPDMVLMDLIMPGMDGVEATRRIMASTPCMILIVTVSVDTNASRVFDAMGYGALDAVNTPALGFGDLRANAAPLLAKIASLGMLNGNWTTPQVASGRPDAGRKSEQVLVAIGASAGGPAALAVVLKALPRNFPAAVVVIQHVDERFVAGMGEWLNQHSALPVRLAKEGDTPTPGAVLLAGSGDHLAFKAATRLGYTPEPREYFYRPSVDVFFQSVCRYWAGKAVGVLLTGMGADGAQGLKGLRAKGYHTIAQDEATSAVYGMPKAAAALKAAVDILPLDRIAPKLVQSLVVTTEGGASA
jgi:chemotaxis response regulator CheB